MHEPAKLIIINYFYYESIVLYNNYSGYSRNTIVTEKSNLKTEIFLGHEFQHARRNDCH